MKTTDIHTIEPNGTALRVPVFRRRWDRHRGNPHIFNLEVWRNCQTGNYFFLKVRIADREIVGYRGRDILFSNKYFDDFGGAIK